MNELRPSSDCEDQRKLGTFTLHIFHITQCAQFQIEKKILLFVKIIKNGRFGDEKIHLVNITIARFHIPKSYHLYGT